MTTLAEFLRARREHLQPADVGLPEHGRRRTPGLRREEVATLAGVSIDYLVRLEQGRDTHPSPSVLGALADALLLDDDERMALQQMAILSHSQGLCPASRAPTRNVVPTVQVLLERLDPTPAFVLGPLNDVLAWNLAWQQIGTPLGLLEPQVPNLARHVFLHPAARAVYPDWVAAADEQVSYLRAATVRWADDAGFEELMAELRSVTEFRSRWEAYGVSQKRRGTKRLVHPDVGELRLSYEVLLLPDDGEQRLITWLPADDATAVALGRAIDSSSPVSPARLRIIG